jgi:GWxTD domain-containing protein
VRVRRSTLLPGILVGLLLGLRPLPLASQSPSERLAIAAFSDSLRSTADTVRLRDRERTLLAAARRHPDGALDPLRLGLVSLRLTELGAAPDPRQAIKALVAATERQPTWPLAWHWLGIAEAQRASWERDNRLELGSRVGVKTLERAATRHRRALEADPSFAPAAEALANVTLELRDTSLLAEAAGALRRAAVARGSAPETFLALGRVERAAANTAAASAAFERYLAVGGWRGLGLLELARTRLAAGDSAAQGAYYEGAASEDSVAVRGYRTDLAPIATHSDLAQFDRARGAERTAYLRRFWTDRDRIEMRGPGERLREHYRRLLYARRHFALTVSRRYYGAADAYRSGSMEIDDRGLIYVRHGEPTERLRPFVFGLMPNESWRFDRAEGDLLFHFSSGWDSNGGGDLYDYRMVESVLDLRGAEDAPRDQLLLSRQKFSRLYGRMLNWGPYGAAKSRALERGIGQASIAIGTSTDSYELRFPENLGAVADMVAVGAAESGRTIGHLVFAIAEPGTVPQPDGLGVRYTARVRAVATDQADRPVARLDTTIVFRLAARLRRNEYLIGRAEMPLLPGPWTWRTAIQLGDSIGVVLPRDTVRVSGPEARLALSDLALGVRGASARWEATPQDTVLLTPFDLFVEGSEVELYYQASGAIGGAIYRHEIAVFRIKGERRRAEPRPVVTLAFEEPAAGPVLHSHRVLQLARLKPGPYLVEVRLTAPGNTAAVRQREFRVVSTQ